MMKLASLCLVVFGLSFQSAFAQENNATENSQIEKPAPTEAQVQNGLENWQKFYEIASHPRCANCHVDDSNIPMWSGPSYGKTRAHGMNINAGDSRIGAEYLPCSTCHGKENSSAPHGPPGNPVWHLPPPEMVWWQKSSSQICAQIKDPERNGDKTLPELVEHVRDDELVHWGWKPGGKREPAPYSIDEAVSFLENWIESGTPCPAQ